jgi:VCBS repeat-containing protein
MRQSDGSEILGPNDPRNLVIGIIHVSPNDDRQSVITAITTQDKLGRDQIVLDLPAQNKSFKSAVDFEGLHQMASEIEATIVLVAPEKSKIANLARRERFTVYPSLDELAQAEFPPLEPDVVETPEQANGAAAAGAQDAAPVEDDEADHARVFPVTPSAAPEAPPAPPQAPPAVPPPAAAPPPELAAPRSQAQIPTAGLPPLEEDEEPTDPALQAVSGSAPAQDDAQAVQGQPAATGSNLPVPVGSSALVPSSPQLPVYYEPIEPPRRRSWRGLIITAIILLLLIGLGVLFYRPILDLFFPPTATVTIVPDSQQLQHTYAMTAVLGVPDPSKNQVDARALYANSQTQSQTVKATGQGHIAGEQAQGVLTFYNASTVTQTVTAGTVIFANNGVAVVNNDTLTLPPFDPAAGPNGVTDSAHTVNVGSSQNIPAYALNDQLCCGGSVYVTNTEPFFGGQDAQTYTYVQQSDIDSVAQALSAPLMQQATTTLQGQVRANERPAGTPRCAPQVRSNHQAGERASTVTVSVMISCVGEVYDMQAVQVLASRDLTQDAATNPGPSYVPVGAILAQVAKATPDNQGNIALVVNAAGVWAYQFTDAQRAHLASLITAKSSQDAKAILLRQPGVHAVTITLTGVGVTTVPGDTHHITIDIEAVQGLHT